MQKYAFGNHAALRKLVYSSTLKISPPKTESFQIKILINFHISAQNIDCGYSLEPPDCGYSLEPQGWVGGAKVSFILRHRGAQLILAYSWQGLLSL